MAEGEILAEEAVTPEETPEEEAVTPEETPEEEEETRTLHMINSRDNNQPFSKEIDGNQKHSCRSGASIGASIDLPRK